MMFAYDATSNLRRLTYPDGWQVTYAYDEVNRVTHAYDGAQEMASALLAEVGYDLSSRRKALRCGNGTRADLAYSGRGDLMDLDLTLAGAPAPNLAYVTGQLAPRAGEPPPRRTRRWLPADPDQKSLAFVTTSLSQTTSGCFS
jgi:hypothetical protein